MATSDGKEIVVFQPTGKFYEDLDRFAKKYGGIKEDALIRATKIDAEVDNICTITVELIAQQFPEETGT